MSQLTATPTLTRTLPTPPPAGEWRPQVPGPRRADADPRRAGPVLGRRRWRRRPGRGPVPGRSAHRARARDRVPARSAHLSLLRLRRCLRRTLRLLPRTGPALVHLPIPRRPLRSRPARRPPTGRRRTRHPHRPARTRSRPRPRRPPSPPSRSRRPRAQPRSRRRLRPLLGRTRPRLPSPRPGLAPAQPAPHPAPPAQPGLPPPQPRPPQPRPPASRPPPSRPARPMARGRRAVRLHLARARRSRSRIHHHPPHSRRRLRHRPPPARRPLRRALVRRRGRLRGVLRPSGPPLPLGRRSDGRLVLRNPFHGLDATPERPGLVATVCVLLGSTAYDGFSDNPSWINVLQTSPSAAPPRPRSDCSLPSPSSPPCTACARRPPASSAARTPAR